MPEGPYLVILKEAAEALHVKGHVIDFAESSDPNINAERLINQKVTDFRVWGKHFLICFEDFTLRIHFMLFGSYLINEQKKTPPRLSLEINDNQLNFYSCSVKFLEGSPDLFYDWEADIMSDAWNPEIAMEKLKAAPGMYVCDALLDQNIFSGSGNIVKNEVLFRTGIHPLSKLGEIPEDKLREIVEETRNYSFDFLRWKKEDTLKKHWLAHTKAICFHCSMPLVKEYLGKSKRRSYFCTSCQMLHGEQPAKKSKPLRISQE